MIGKRAGAKRAASGANVPSINKLSKGASALFKDANQAAATRLRRGAAGAAQQAGRGRGVRAGEQPPAAAGKGVRTTAGRLLLSEAVPLALAVQ